MSHLGETAGEIIGVEVVLFDVNETLLEMRALDPYFERLFGRPSVRERWFEELKGIWLVATITDDFHDFMALADAALEIVAQKERVDLSDEDRAELPKLLTELPAHPDAAPALTLLRDEGFRLATLTNGTSKGVSAQLNSAQLEDYFERTLSVDRIRRYKPAPEPYFMAAEELAVKPEEICLVAAHDWDIAGASAAGLRTAFVQRPRKVLNPVGPKPDFLGVDLVTLAEQIVARAAVS